MPISITITSPETLSERQIEDLNAYLLASQKATIPEFLPAQIIEGPVRPPLWAPTPKSSKVRKKQTLKVPEPQQKTEQAEIPNILEVSYEEVIAFVLENTREKRLNFDAVMEVITRFKIPNLNSLDKYPDLIVPVYIALKELAK